MSHVLAVCGHRHGRGIRSGRMVLVTGAPDKGSERERGKAGEDQGRGAKGCFGHIYKWERTPGTYFSNGVNTPCLRAVCRCKHQAVKTDSKKRSLRLGKFIASVYDVYFPSDHGYYGTDADHLPVIPGNDFAPDASYREESPLQEPASGNADRGPFQIGK